MKYNFVVYSGGEYFNHTSNITDEDTFEQAFEDLQKEVLSRYVKNTKVLFIFADKNGLSKFSDWIFNKFRGPVGKETERHEVSGGTMFYIQPFGKIHVIEV